MSANTWASSSATAMMRWFLAKAMGTRVASAVEMRSGSICATYGSSDSMARAWAIADSSAMFALTTRSTRFDPFSRWTA
jgi:hypothetical protein